MRSTSLSSALSASVSCFSRAGISPYRRRDARSRLPSRWLRSASMRRPSSRVLSSPIRLSSARSFSQRAESSPSFADFSAKSSRNFARRSLEAASFSFASASSSSFSRSTIRRSSSISIGAESISMRRRDAASSIRSMALSGSCRPVMYRLDRPAAATSALSAIVTLWWAS